MIYDIEKLKDSTSFKDIPLFIAYIRDRLVEEPTLLNYDIAGLVECALFTCKANYYPTLISKICDEFERRFFKRIYLPLDDATITEQIAEAKQELEYYEHEVLTESRD